MLLVAAVVAAGSQSPSVLETALIAFGGAIVGAVIGALTQIRIERQRDSRERDLDRLRAERDEAADIRRKEREQVSADRADEVREHDEAAIARGAARLLQEDLRRAGARVRSARAGRNWWHESTVLTQHLASADRPYSLRE